jgi:hypothetical protein
LLVLQKPGTNTVAQPWFELYFSDSHPKLKVMKLIYLFPVIGIVSLLSCKNTNQVNESYQGYQPFPAGYDYLQDTSALGKAVKAGNTTYVREHAWKLWAGIMQPGKGIDWPVWYTWPTSAQAFAEDVTNLKTGTNQASIIETRRSLIQMSNSNKLGQIMDTLHLPYYPIPPAVISMFHNDSTIFVGNNTIADGRSFLFNGDIMIPSESLTIQGFDWIRKNRLYKKSTLDSLHNAGMHDLDAPPTYVVTKHMYWPVPAQGISAIPVWNDDYSVSYPGYAGYEVWKNLAAIDPSGKFVGQTAKVSYLYGVYNSDSTPMKTITKQAKVYSLNNFYYHKVTQADWNALTDRDKAIINASSYWAYNKPFGIGDYLVTIAMHVNTKEVPTWALQSVWWSDTPNTGEYAANRPSIPSAKGPWTHYKLVDAYGIPQKANPTELPVGMNPYIELVIHPVATNCNNCHRRAGEDSRYQSLQCPDMLGILHADSPCLKKLLLTDFQWIIPDRAKK